MSIAFLIFSASSFEILSTIMVMVGEQIIGSDMYADTQGWGFLDEVGLSQFLDEQKALPTHPVIDYAFVTSTLGGTLNLA